MRTTAAFLLLATLAAARPPQSPHFKRMDVLRDRIAERYQKLVEAEEYARKPREEKILLSFDSGAKRFDKKKLDGEFVVETILEWDQVATETPSEAGRRCLEMLPHTMDKTYAQTVDIDKRDRYDASMALWKALDSKYEHVRSCAIESLMKIYRTRNSLMYQPNQDERQRRDSIRRWRNFIRKQR